MIITRRAFTAALSLTGLACCCRLLAPVPDHRERWRRVPPTSPNRCRCRTWLSVPRQRHRDDHRICLDDLPALRGLQPETVFPKIKSEYIDSGKIRFVFREFPLDIKAAAGSMLARCIAKGNYGKYFAVIDMLFKQQGDWVMKNTTETLTRIGKQAGLSQQAGRGLPQGPGAARQDRRRPEIRHRGAEGRIRRRPSSSTARRSRARPRSTNSTSGSSRC